MCHTGERLSPSENPKRTRKRCGVASKALTCKRCGFAGKSKEDMWVHAKTHIPDTKQLLCTKCSFVTEHKHHLLYHVSTQHSDIKPFKCAFCGYTCVCKSMLASHMRSLLNVQVIIFFASHSGPTPRISRIGVKIVCIVLGTVIVLKSI